MFAPLFRILSGFLIVIGLLAGSQGAYSLVFQADPGRFARMMLVALVLALTGYRIRQLAGELDLIAIEPEAIANNFELPKALGLGANASPWVTMTAGAVAGAAVVGIAGLAGFVTPGALLAAMAVFAVYGAVLAWIKRRALGRGGLVKSRDGRYYAAHRRVSQYAVPAIVVIWLVLSAPEANPLTVGLIAAGLLFWIGKGFHHVWDVSHTALLVLYYGEHSPTTIEWGLGEWLRRSRRDLEVTSVTYVPDVAEARVTGRFYRPEELERDMRRLDFLKKVTLIPDEGPEVS